MIASWPVCFGRWRDGRRNCNPASTSSVKGLLEGRIAKAAEHHPDDDTCCLPLIDDYVVVFRPDQSDQIERDKTGRSIVHFSNATLFDLLNIEEEDRE